ncbi:MAG: hypothetical protein B6240_02645 [Desulfobacteraceae bacterium 4572_87]|nr:MAG: hypothetical protein B6240_02645 [Desulfobacteraceae bacterium 4572_87]
MAHLISFSRSRCTTVEESSDGIMTCTCRVTDNLLDGRVQIQATLPDLEIMTVSSHIDHSRIKGMSVAEERLQNLLGVRVGPGMLKIIEGLMGDDPACVELAFMAEECCHGAILSLTKETLKKAPLEPVDSRDFFSKMVQKNIRLYNRCAAFADGSTLLDGVDIS